MSDFRKRTVSGLGWSAMAQLLAEALQFVFSVALARLLRPADFGLFGMVAVVTGFANVFADLGLAAALIQRKQLEQKHTTAVFYLNLSVGLGLTIVLIAIAPFVARFFGEPRLRGLTMVCALAFSLGAPRVVQSALLRRQLQFRKIAYATVFGMAAGGVVAIIMALTGMGVWSLAGQSLVRTGLTTALLWYNSSWRPARRCAMAGLRDLMRFSINLFSFNTLNYWIRNADNLLIGKFVGKAQLGAYTRAYSLMLLPVTQVSRMMTQVMFPALASIQHDHAALRQVYLRATAAISLITFPFLLGLLVVADTFVAVVYGPAWVPVAPLLQVLCLAGFVQSVSSNVGWIYTATGRTDLMLRWGIAAGIVVLTSFSIGINWGALGVAKGYAAASLLLWLPGWVIPARIIGMRLVEMLFNLKGTATSAIVMAACVWVVSRMAGQSLPNWLLLLCQVTTGVVVYVALILLFRVHAFTDVTMVLKEHFVQRKTSLAAGKRVERQQARSQR